MSGYPFSVGLTTLSGNVITQPWPVNPTRRGKKGATVPSSRPTMHDVARLAGVSVTTVSRAINNHRYVRADTRSRVDEAIATLRFQRNDIARTLRPGQTTSTIALLIEDVANPFYSAIAAGVDDVAQQHQHLLIVGNTRLDSSRERELISEMIRRRVDGLIVVPTAQDHSELHGDVPMVFVDRPPTGLEADTVLLDNHSGARRAVGHLITAGHRRIAYVGGDPEVHTGAKRLTGYRQALRRGGIDYQPSLVRLGNHTIDDADATVAALLHEADAPTAIFTDNNRMTVGALQAIYRARARVDLAAFDDIELADLLTMPVALVTYEPAELGRRAAQLLFARIQGTADPPQRVVLKTRLTIRGRPTNARPGSHTRAASAQPAR